MDSRTIPFARHRLLEQGPTGFRFSFGDGETIWIDFEACRVAWARYACIHLGKEITPEQTRCVAHRDFTARPPFFEFLTEPRLRLEFRHTLRCWRPRAVFLRFQSLLQRLGWTSYDLS